MDLHRQTFGLDSIVELVGDGRNRRKDRGPHVANPVTFHEGAREEG